MPQSLWLFATELESRPIKKNIDNGRRVESQHLAHDQSADDGNPQRTPELRPCAGAESERQRAEQGSHRCHQNRPEAQLAGFKDSFGSGFAVLALRHEGKVDHHDRIFFHNANQQNDANDRNHVQVDVEQHQRQHRSYAGRRQGGNNSERMHQAFIKYAQDNVDRQDRRDDKHRLTGKRGLVCRRRSGKKPAHGLRHIHLLLHLAHLARRVAQRYSGRKIKRNSDGRKRTGVIHGKRRGGCLGCTDRGQRDHAVARGIQVNIL